MRDINSKCGVCVGRNLHDTINYLKQLQHRGREAAGIMAKSENNIRVVKWSGPVNAFDLKDFYKLFPNSQQYYFFAGHVRYATRGRKDMILQDAHPHTIGGRVIDNGNHIIIDDCEAAIVHNGQVDLQGVHGIEGFDPKTGCDTLGLLRFYQKWGMRKLISSFPCSYTLALMDKNLEGVQIARDRMGVKPGVLGLKHGKYCMASEDIALRKNGGEFVENLEPGALYHFLPDGNYKKESIVAPSARNCFFEWNYIADVDSIMNKIPVRMLREKLGEKLADEFNPGDIDLVTYLPRCPEVAARSYAQKINVPFIEVFYKMHSERSFLGTDRQERERSINKNLHVLPDVSVRLAGKNVAIIDDSIIRGNNSKRAVDLLKSAGVKKIYFLSYTPPMCIRGSDGILRGCIYGVDMPVTPPAGEGYIARDRSFDEISQIMGVDTIYLSIESLVTAFESFGLLRKNLCTFCIGGPALRP